MVEAAVGQWAGVSSNRLKPSPARREPRVRSSSRGSAASLPSGYEVEVRVRVVGHLELIKGVGAAGVQVEDPQTCLVVQDAEDIGRRRAVVLRGATPVLEDDDGLVPRDRVERALQDKLLRTLHVDLDEVR